MKFCKNCNMQIADKAIICPHCGIKIKKPFYKTFWFWTIIIIIIIFISLIGSNENKNENDINNDVIGNNTSIETSNEINSNFTESAVEYDSKEIDKKICEIISAEIGYTNYEGKPTVIITYNYTNNSTSSKSFDMAFTHTVFQNGIECSKDYLYKEENSIKDIRPGTSIEVKKSYILNDIVTDIEVEVSGFLTWDNTIISKTFSIK